MRIVGPNRSYSSERGTVKPEANELETSKQVNSGSITHIGNPYSVIVRGVLMH